MRVTARGLVLTTPSLCYSKSHLRPQPFVSASSLTPFSRYPHCLLFLTPHSRSRLYLNQKMHFQVPVGLAMAALSQARPWYNTSSVAFHDPGHGTGLIGTSPYHATGYYPAAAGLFSSLSTSEAGCSVSYVTVTAAATPASVTTDSPLSSTTSVEKPYSYAIESGTTSWIDGVAPPATGYVSTVSESSTVLMGTTTVTTYSESSTVLVGTITVTTYSTTTENVRSSSEVCHLQLEIDMDKFL